ncbi:MAG: FAD:protein FMN transferase [Candidatus Nanopelagicales bacterium]
MDTPISRSASVPSWGAGRSAFEPFRTARPRLALRERRFRAMGCNCHILTLGSTEAMLDSGEQRVRELDDCWTRFSPESELSQFNAQAGRDVAISADMRVLLDRALEGYELSGGLFDPFLADQIVAAGYDRDFDELNAAPITELAGLTAVTRSPTTSSTVSPEPGSRTRPAPLWLAPDGSSARLEPGSEVDSGGIGKGLGADLVADFLIDSGVKGVMVNLGGDVAVSGSYPDEGWRIGIDDPLGRSDAGTSVVLRDGALCTSGILRRRWLADDGHSAHHILDPLTGRSLESKGFVGASAIAPYGWLAEVLTKTTLVGGERVGQALLEQFSDCALLVWDNDAKVRQLSAGG